MKKKLFISSVLVLGLVALLSGCSGKDNNGSEDFSSLTPEQHKQAIEQAGTQVLDQLDGMKNLSALQIIIDFTNLDDQIGGGLNSPAIRNFVAPFAKMTQNPGSALNVRTLVSSPKTLADLFNDNKGIYTYNSTQNKWIKTASSTEITFVFPTKNSTTNNASLTLNNFSSIASPTAATVGDYDAVLVKSLNFTIKKQNATALSFAMTGAYNGDGLPTKLTETLSFSEGYTLTGSLSNTGTVVTFDQSLKKGDANIVSSHLDCNGNFNYSTIDTNVNSDDESAVSKIINSGNVWITVGNVKVVGLVDLKSIFAELPTDIDYSKQAAVGNEATIINKHSSFYAKYVDKNEIIAKGAFYAAPYSDYYWDYSTQKGVTKTYYELMPKLTFKDGSSMDESFFENGFDKFITQFEDLVDALGTNYGN